MTILLVLPLGGFCLTGLTQAAPSSITNVVGQKYGAKARSLTIEYVNPDVKSRDPDPKNIFGVGVEKK